MASRGVLFAIDDETASALLAADSDDAVIEIVEAVEAAWDQEFLAETDKAWDAIHRALADGSLEPGAGAFPLNQVILGGRHLYSGEDYFVAFVGKEEVRAVAIALAKMSDDDMRRRYDEVVPRDYAPEYGADDREFTVEWWNAVVQLYARAARAGRAVIFTVDQ